MGSVTGPQTRTPRAKGTRAAGPARTPEGQAVGGGRVPNHRHPSHRLAEPLPPTNSCHPRGALCPKGHARRGASAGPPHPHPSTPKEQGQRAPAARPKEEQPQ